MIHNRFNRLCAPLDDTEMAAEGLGSRLSTFLGDNPTGEAPEAPTDPPPGQETPAGETVVPPTEETDVEEEFPELGKPAPVTAETTPAAFDEAAFDASTEEEVKGMEVKAGAKFKALKANLKEATKELLALKSKPATVELPAEVQTELATLRATALEAEGLRQRNTELLQLNDAVAVRESPEFIAQVKEPIAAMDGILALIAESAGLDLQVLAAVVLETDFVKQDKMLDQLEPKLGRSMRKLEKIVEDYKGVKDLETRMLANPGKSLETTRAAREQAAKAEQAVRTGAFKAATTESFTAYAARVPGFTDSSGSLTDLAKATLAKTVSIDPQSLTPEDLGYMGFCTNAFPEARKAIVALQKENALLRAGKPLPKPLGGADTPAAEVVETEQPHGLVDAMKGKVFTFNGA